MENKTESRKLVWMLCSLSANQDANEIQVVAIGWVGGLTNIYIQM